MKTPAYSHLFYFFFWTSWEVLRAESLALANNNQALGRSFCIIFFFFASSNLKSFLRLHFGPSLI